MEGEQVRHDRPLHCNVEASSDKAPPSARMAMAVVEPCGSDEGRRSAVSGERCEAQRGPHDRGNRQVSAEDQRFGSRGRRHVHRQKQAQIARGAGGFERGALRIRNGSRFAMRTHVQPLFRSDDRAQRGQQKPGGKGAYPVHRSRESNHIRGAVVLTGPGLGIIGSRPGAVSSVASRSRRVPDMSLVPDLPPTGSCDDRAGGAP